MTLAPVVRSVDCVAVTMLCSSRNQCASKFVIKDEPGKKSLQPLCLSGRRGFLRSLRWRQEVIIDVLHNFRQRLYREWKVRAAQTLELLAIARCTLLVFSLLHGECANASLDNLLVDEPANEPASILNKKPKNLVYPAHIYQHSTATLETNSKGPTARARAGAGAGAGARWPAAGSFEYVVRFAY